MKTISKILVLGFFSLGIIINALEKLIKIRRHESTT